MNITSNHPILQVNDIRESIRFYCEVLGFEEDFIYGEPPYYAGIRRNDSVFHLCSSEVNVVRLGLGSVYVICDEVDEYYKEVIEKGAQITNALETFPYGLRDSQLKDLDGNLICFGCPVDR